ncbi:MAG: hypothetical protein AB7V16_08760 [Vulcanibacillus sp.]
MAEDFYFVYGYNGNTATRLYRFLNGNFERYNPIAKSWDPDPEQCRIFIGEDLDYEEITEEQANRIEVTV